MTKTIIIRRETTIQVPYSDGILRVAYPFFGPANARSLRAQVRADNLMEPTSRDLALFALAVYVEGEKEQKKRQK